jgi:hypothetical protein
MEFARGRNQTTDADHAEDDADTPAKTWVVGISKPRVKRLVAAV